MSNEDVKLEEDLDEAALADDDDISDEDLEAADDLVEDAEDSDADGGDDTAPQGEAALDELAEEELELLDEETETDLPVNEAEELRAIRREELTMDVEAQAIRGDEFVCSVCFLVKRSSQLANRRKVICHDCAA